MYPVSVPTRLFVSHLVIGTDGAENTCSVSLRLRVGYQFITDPMRPKYAQLCLFKVPKFQSVLWTRLVVIIHVDPMVSGSSVLSRQKLSKSLFIGDVLVLWIDVAN